MFKVLLISMFFFFPETKYTRENTNAQYHHRRETSTVPKGNDLGTAETAERGHTERREKDVDAEPGLAGSTTIGQGYPTKLQRFGLNLRPDRAEIKLIPRDIITPFQIATYPIVFFASCCLGFGANCLLVLNLLESPGFSASPYNFSPASVGYVNFALMGGGIFGLLTAGPFSDWVSMKLTVRNKGIREPEMRLPAFIPFVSFGFIGLLVRRPIPTMCSRETFEY